MSYTAPLKDMLFDIEHLARIDQVAALPGFEESGLDTAQAVLEECAKLTEGVVAPLNWEGDKNPSSFSQGVVTTTAGFKDAFRQYGEGGWQGLQHPTEFGGQGLPKTIGAACIEMLNSANMSFALCPLLTDGAIEALLTAGSDELKATYLEKLISGQWTGTMNLTEPQAGSDLAAVVRRMLKTLPAAFAVLLVSLLETWRGCHHTVFPARGVLVAFPVQGRNHALVELGAFLEHRLRGFQACVLETGDGGNLIDVGEMLQIEQHVFDRCGEAHGESSIKQSLRVCRPVRARRQTDRLRGHSRQR